MSWAAVLLLLFSKEGQYHLLLNKRTELVEHHKGEICFPGGAWDPEDADLWATALREAQEEMGIEPRDVEVLGELDPVTTARSGFLVRPVIGRIPYPYAFRVSPVEIAHVLEVPVSALLEPGNRRAEPLSRSGRAVEARADLGYAYYYQGHRIWGATARILTQFLGLLVAAVQQSSGQALKQEASWSNQHPA